MKLSEIVKQALQKGYLTPELEAQVMKICHPNSVLSTEEDFYLNQLMGAILSGTVSGLFLW